MAVKQLVRPAINSGDTKGKNRSAVLTKGVFALLIFTSAGLAANVRGAARHFSQRPKALLPKVVALTFDDGPYGNSTMRILDILRAKGVQATFFVVGKNAERYPELLRREAREGHTIGNHSFNHTRMLEFEAPSNLRNNVFRADSVIAAITGLHPRIFRPPYGMRNLVEVRNLKMLGYSVILWTDETKDFQSTMSPQAITKNILRKLRPGAIICVHDGRDVHSNYPRENLIKALPDIIDQARQAGYSFVTLDALLGIRPYFSYNPEHVYKKRVR